MKNEIKQTQKIKLFVLLVAIKQRSGKPSKIKKARIVGTIIWRPDGTFVVNAISPKYKDIISKELNEVRKQVIYEPSSLKTKENAHEFLGKKLESTDPRYPLFLSNKMFSSYPSQKSGERFVTIDEETFRKRKIPMGIIGRVKQYLQTKRSRFFVILL